MRRVAAVLAALLAVAACTPEAGDSGSLEVSGSSEAGEAPPTPAACPQRRLAAIDEVVAQQLAAFRDRDFAAALALATDGFRSSFTPERFEQVMTDSFAAVLASDDHEVSQCVGADGQALALVELRGPGGAVGLLYDMRHEDGRWRINGASPHTGDPAATPSEPETI